MLPDLFKTPERERILSFVLFSDGFTVSQASRKTGVTKGLVSRYLAFLRESGLLEIEGRIYRPKDCALTRGVKVLLNITRINASRLDLEWADGLGIFGSWARGTNTLESGLDAWVKAERYPSEVRLARLSRDLREMAGEEVHLLVLTPEKVRGIKRTDPAFYDSLIYNSTVIIGEGIDDRYGP